MGIASCFIDQTNSVQKLYFLHFFKEFKILLLIAYCLLLRYKFLRLSNGVIMSNYKKIFSIACISVVLSGCGWMNIDPEYSSSGGGRVTAASVNQILGSDFETFNDEKMLYLLNPKIHKDDNFHKTYFPYRRDKQSFLDP